MFFKIISNKNKIIFFLASWAVLILFFAQTSQAAITKEISYQGKLTNASNVAVANGDYAMIIRIYDADSGGNCLWSAQGDCGSPTARNVTVANGIFSIMLGETGDNPITLDFNSSYYLGVQVGADAEMTPRKKVGAVGYAFNTLNMLSDGRIDLDNVTATNDAVNVNYNPTSGTSDAAEIIYGAGGGTGTALKVAQNGNGVGAMITNLGSGLSFRVNDETGEADTSPFVIDASGNVGIGTMGPVGKLHVIGGTSIFGPTTGGTYDGTFQILQSDNYPQIRFLAGATTKASLLSDVSNGNLYLDFAGSMNFRNGGAGGTNVFTILNDGNVGIGTTSPSGLLHVRNATGSTQGYIDGSDANNAWLGYMSNGSVKWLMGNNGHTAGNLFTIGKATGLDTSTPYLAIDHTNGNVGIGTTTPGYKLDVAGDINITGNFKVNGTNLAAGIGGAGTANYLPIFATGTTLGNSAIYQSSGNIGIGTAVPDSPLHVQGATFPQSRVNNYNLAVANGEAGLRFRSGGTSGDAHADLGWTGTGAETGNLVFRVPYTSERMRIQSNGNVGIGTTGPGATLDVYTGGDPTALFRANGDVNVGLKGSTSGNTQLFSIRSNGTSVVHLNTQNSARLALGVSTGTGTGTIVENMTITSTGNVGIGTTAPGEKFQVLRDQASYTRVASFYDTSATGIPYITVGKANGEGADTAALLAYDTANNTGWLGIAGDSLGTGIHFKRGGNVGIGTTAPNFSLDIKPGVSNAITRVGSFTFMENVVSNQSMFGRNVYYDSAWKYANNGYATAIRMYDDPGDGSIAFHLAGSGTAGGTPAAWDSTDVKMVIRNSGYVGIGTTDPGAYKLNVNGNTYVAGTINASGHITGNYIFGSYLNASAGNSENPTIGQVWTQSTGDDYLRKSTPAHFISQLGLIYSGNIGSQSVNYATSATYLNSSNYINQTGNTGTWNSDFQNTPAGTARYGGDVGAQTTGNPGGTWWIQQNFRHTNTSNYWGTQVAWGWEDNANRLATRNVTGGTFGSWVYYLNSGNYNSYAPTLTGGGASGTWGINITGNAATAGTAAEATNNYFYVRGTSPSTLYVDTDDGVTRYVHQNGGNIGFLGNGGSWILRVDDAGTVIANTFSGALSGNASTATYATSAGNADTVDSQHFAWSNADNNPTYLWGANSNGSSFLAARGSMSVNYANYSNYSNYLPTSYIGGVQLNPQTYFNNGIGLKVAMTGYPSTWSDTLWINGYSGGDVPNMIALHFIRNGTPRMWISSQSFSSTSYGTAYEVISSYNIASQTVATAGNLTGHAAGYAYADGGTSTLTNGVNQNPNRTDGSFYQVNWNNAAAGDTNLYSSANVTLRSSYPGAIQFRGAYTLEGNDSYGLYSNTGLYAAGGLWDAGNRVYSGGNPQVNISGSAGSANYLNTAGLYYQGGNVGIGTVSPGYNLDVSGIGSFLNSGAGTWNGSLWVSNNNASAAVASGILRVMSQNTSASNSLMVATNSATTVYGLNSDGSFFYNIGATGSPILHGLASGNVGIGTTAPAANLNILGTSGLHLQYSNAYGANGYRLFTASDHSYLGIGYVASGAWYPTAGTPAMVIQSTNGYVGIGNTPGYKLDVQGDVVARGSVYSSTYGWLSDERLKQNIEPVASPIETLMQINGKSFDWRTAEFPDKNFPDGIQYGMIAQEVEEILPAAVTIMNDGFKTVNYAAFTPFLIEAIKQQQTQIIGVSALVSGLQNSFTEQEKDLQELALALATLATNEENKTAIAEQKIDTLENNLNFGGSQINLLSGKLNTVSQKLSQNFQAELEIPFYEFASESSELSATLTDTAFGDGQFSGTYASPENFQEVALRLTSDNQIDLTDKDLAESYLVYDVYISDPSALEDYNTELGNELDQKELQWNKINHPFFQSGWNEVRLPIEDGLKTGVIDWQQLNYFRAYFKFSATEQLQFKNIRLETKASYQPLAQTVDAKELDLFNNADQGTALKDIFATLDSIKTQDLASLQVDTELTQDLKEMQEQVALLQEETRAVIDLSLAMNLENVLYKDSTGSVLGLNIIAAEEVKAKKVEAQDYVVSENVDPLKNNVGSVIVRVGEQEVLVKNETVTIDSKIIVTPVGSSPVAWVISDKINSTGFKIKLDKPAEFDIAFDYWVIGVEK